MRRCWSSGLKVIGLILYMNRIRTVTLLLLMAGLGFSACGRPISIARPTTPTPTVSPTAGRGGIASGAAVGNLPGIAPPAPPPAESPLPAFRVAAVAEACPNPYPVKLGRDHRAYAPGHPDYAAVPAIECYTTLAAAASYGYPPAAQSSGGPPAVPSATRAP
jgi:hypothetical protein